MSVVDFPPLPRTDHARDVQRVWRALMRSTGSQPSEALAEAAQWIVEARLLLAQASSYLDPIFQAQIEELLARESCRPEGR